MQQYISVVAALADAELLDRLRAAIGRQHDMILLADTGNDVEALHAVGSFRPNVLLLDASVADTAEAGADAQLLAAIHACSPRTRTIVLSGHHDPGFVAEAVRQGARGHLRRNPSVEECLRAVRAVAQGEAWIGRHEIADLLDELLVRPQQAETVAAAPSNRLSQRESEIATAVQLGLTNKEIARKLQISDTTVKTYIERIFHKLKVSRRVQIGATIRAALASAADDCN